VKIQKQGQCYVQKIEDSIAVCHIKIAVLYMLSMYVCWH